MREFRGKRVDGDRWVYGYYLCLRGVDEPLHIIVDGRGEYHTCRYDTIGEFSGVEDEAGKKIYEGDIVSGLFRFGMEVKAICAFRDGSFGLLWLRGKVEEFTAFTGTCNITWRVLGNITDDPIPLGEEEAQ